jgi:hypothetical protein
MPSDFLYFYSEKLRSKALKLVGHHQPARLFDSILIDLQNRQFPCSVIDSGIAACFGAARCG